jgi:thiol-disulfide isomerase/thioredoxin
MKSMNKKGCLKMAMVIVMAFSQAIVVAQNSKEVALNVSLRGLENGMVVIRQANPEGAKTDSLEARNGILQFKTQAKGPLLYNVYLPEGKTLSFFAAPGEKISVKGDLNDIKSVKFKGSVHQPAWQAWENKWNYLHLYAGTIFKKLDSIGKAKGDQRFYQDKLKDWDRIMVDSVDAFVKKYPGSPVAAWVIDSRFVVYPFPEKAEMYYGMLTEQAKKSPYGLALGKSVHINSKTSIGKKPDFSQPDTDGNPFKLASLKGKVVLVDFWASWCGPCRKENPNLVKAYAAYHDKGFEIVGVSLDDKKENWLKAIAADQLTWLHVSDLKGWKNELAVSYGIKSVPTSFLLDASGRIIAKDLRGEALENKLKELFN